MNLKGQVPLEVRVQLTRGIKQRIRERMEGKTFEEFAQEQGLSVHTLTDIVTINRANSTSSLNYVKILGEEPPSDIREEIYSYDQIKPVLAYLDENLGIGPTRILKRSPAFYKNHKSPSISGEIYRYAENLMERAKKALSSGSWMEVENIMSEVYGKKPGERILYQRVKPLLDYLGSKGESVKKLLGRTESIYKSSRFRTISRERYGVIIGLVNEHLTEEEKEHAMQAPESTFPLTTFTEVRRLANAVFDGYDVSQMAIALAKLTTGRSAKALELCLTEENLSLRNTDVAFEALGRMSSEQLGVARKNVEYNNKSVHYPGELIYVLGVKQFGVVTNVEGEQNLNEADVFVRTFPSQREIKLFSGAVKKTTYRWNTHK